MDRVRIAFILSEVLYHYKHPKEEVPWDEFSVEDISSMCYHLDSALRYFEPTCKQFTTGWRIDNIQRVIPEFIPPKGMEVTKMSLWFPNGDLKSRIEYLTVLRDLYEKGND